MSFCILETNFCEKHRKRIDLTKGCEDCEKEAKEMENKDIDIDKKAKNVVEMFKELGKILSSFDENKIKEILMKNVKPTLSEAERVILENIDKDYKWIARDKGFNALYVYEDKPIKNATNNWGNDKNNASLEIYNHIFQFITWQDDEPYNIEELLKGK